LVSPAKVRAAGQRVLSTTPLYRVLPPGEVRAAAALLYQHAKLTPDQICRHWEKTGTVPTRHPLAAQVVVRGAALSAFLPGLDHLAREILAPVADRFPEIADVALLESDLRVSYGDYAGGLAHAIQARLRQPDRAEAAAKVVWLHYLTGDVSQADRLAVEAASRFPQSGRVLWEISRGCRSVEQFTRFAGAWREAVPGPEHLLAGARPLAAAAARAGLLDLAVDILAEGMVLGFDGRSPQPVTPRRNLRDQRPMAAVADICAALDAAGIPFFFAAGTALGLIREGRPLGHDVDIDVGVFARDWDRDALVEAFRKHAHFLPDVAHPRNDKVAIKHRAGAAIDVFRFYDEGGDVWHAGTFTRWRNSPFRVHRRDVVGVQVPLPEDDERYLVENYGEDWRTPDAGFDAFTDAPNVEVTWPEYYDYHLVRRAYRRLAAGDRAAAVDDLDAAAATLGRTLSGRRLLELVGRQPAAASDAPAAPPSFDFHPQSRPASRASTLADAEAAIDRARQARAGGDRATAVAIIERALRDGAWRFRLLWHERLTLMEAPADYPAIRDLLWASPRECHKGVGALRAVARAACMAEQHDEGRALLRKSILWETRKRTSKLQALRAARRAVTEPGRAVPAREVRPFADTAAEGLGDLRSLLDDLGARSFLVAGTFLGFVRERSVIAWDKDIDMGVFRDETDMDALQDACIKHGAFSVRRLDLTTDRLRITHTNGVNIDVFPHYEEGGRLWHDGAATRWWNTPFDLEEVTFLATRQLAPADADRYLTESYGDWRRPDPDFDARLDAPNVEVTDPGYFHSLQFFDLLKAVVKGDERRKQRHIGLLRDAGEGSWLDRL
jgi:hypothetical protein